MDYERRAVRNNFVRDSTKKGLWLLLAAVGFLLLIACANVANLLLAHAAAFASAKLRCARRWSDEQRDRPAGLPSSKRLVLALAAGIAGALSASVLLDGIVALMPEYTLPSETEITLSVPVLLFALGVCAISGALSGLAPAWQAARADLVDAIKEGGGAIGGGRHLLRRVLVVLEFALALTLLAGGGLAAHAFIKTMSVDLGYRTDNVLTLHLPVRRGRFTTPEEVEIFYRQLLDRTANLAGRQVRIDLTGHADAGHWTRQRAGNRGPSQQSSGYAAGRREPGDTRFFETLGISLLRGRAFTERIAGEPARGDCERGVRQALSGGVGAPARACPHETVHPSRALAAHARARRVGDRRRVRQAT